MYDRLHASMGGFVHGFDFNNENIAICYSSAGTEKKNSVLFDRYQSILMIVQLLNNPNRILSYCDCLKDYKNLQYFPECDLHPKECIKKILCQSIVPCLYYSGLLQMKEINCTFVIHFMNIFVLCFVR